MFTALGWKLLAQLQGCGRSFHAVLDVLSPGIASVPAQRQSGLHASFSMRSSSALARFAK